MNCPQCKSSRNKKNGFRRGKQSYRCKDCHCQYVENPKSREYPNEVKQLCLKMYVNGMGFRAIARITEIDHTTIINWVEKAGKSLSDEPTEAEIPEITEIDELQTFVGNKKHKLWIWTVVNHQKQGILLWNIGDRSHQSFEPLWQIIKCWHSFWYVTDGWKVYPMYIEPEDHLVSKTYMTRVEGENTRLRHYLARLHRKTLCYSKSLLLLKYSLRLLLHYLRFGTLQISF
jgi:insertion element IS1 protein InsB